MVWEEEMRKQIETPAPTPMESLTLRQWGNGYLNEVQRRRSKGTYVEARTAFKLLGMSLGPDFKVEDIDPGVALKHLDAQHDSRSGNASNKDRKNLARAWDWGKKFLKNFPVEPNPFRVVDKYPEQRRPRYVPPEQDYLRVMEQTEGQDRVMLTAMFHLAARKGEIFRLTWADVDFVNSKVRLSTRKTADGSWKIDWLPMTKELKRELLWWKDNRQNQQAEHVFTVLDGTPFTNQWEGQPFKVRQHFMAKLSRKAGVKEFGFHAIRHLSAVILYQAGYNVAMIQVRGTRFSWTRVCEKPCVLGGPRNGEG